MCFLVRPLLMYAGPGHSLEGVGLYELAASPLLGDVALVLERSAPAELYEERPGWIAPTRFIVPEYTLVLEVRSPPGYATGPPAECVLEDP